MLRALKYATIFSLSLLLCSCLTRKQVEADVWNTKPIPKEICDKNPELYNSGFYRRLDDDVCQKTGHKVPCYEVIPFCGDAASHMFAIIDTDLNKILDSLTPEEKQQ